MSSASSNSGRSNARSDSGGSAPQQQHQQYQQQQQQQFQQQMMQQQAYYAQQQQYQQYQQYQAQLAMYQAQQQQQQQQVLARSYISAPQTPQNQPHLQYTQLQLPPQQLQQQLQQQQPQQPQQYYQQLQQHQQQQQQQQFYQQQIYNVQPSAAPHRPNVAQPQQQQQQQQQQSQKQLHPQQYQQYQQQQHLPPPNHIPHKALSTPAPATSPPPPVVRGKSNSGGILERPSTPNLRSQQKFHKSKEDDDSSSVTSTSSTKSFSGFMNGFKRRLGLNKDNGHDLNSMPHQSSGVGGRRTTIESTTVLSKSIPAIASTAASTPSPVPDHSSEAMRRIQQQQQHGYVRGIYPSEPPRQIQQQLQPLQQLQPQLQKFPGPPPAGFSPVYSYNGVPPPQIVQNQTSPGLYIPAPPARTPVDFTKPPPGQAIPAFPPVQQGVPSPAFSVSPPVSETKPTQVVSPPTSPLPTSYNSRKENENGLSLRFSFEKNPEQFDSKPVAILTQNSVNSNPSPKLHLPSVNATIPQLSPSDEEATKDDGSPSADGSSTPVSNMTQLARKNSKPATQIANNAVASTTTVTPLGSPPSGIARAASLTRKFSDNYPPASVVDAMPIRHPSLIRASNASPLDSIDGIEGGGGMTPNFSRSLDRAASSLNRTRSTLGRSSNVSGGAGTTTGTMQSIVHEDVALVQGRANVGHLFWVDDTKNGGVDVHPVKIFEDTAVGGGNTVGNSGDEGGGILLRKRSTLRRVASSNNSSVGGDSISVSVSGFGVAPVEEETFIVSEGHGSLSRTRSFKLSHVVITPDESAVSETSPADKTDNDVAYKTEDLETGNVAKSDAVVPTVQSVSVGEEDVQKEDAFAALYEYAAATVTGQSVPVVAEDTAPSRPVIEISGFDSSASSGPEIADTQRSQKQFDSGMLQANDNVSISPQHLNVSSNDEENFACE
ncbi:hypothetical protein HK100_004154 [Physocladia obscura]|uniref:Uncharacterized protein n=1 Tax=Physocladia obscura TaxID=109957 RepID=A0AAD5SVS1_9FUNG|nr:hypothetical protein HK100_004154 [Physocladia obscura]